MFIFIKISFCFFHLLEAISNNSEGRKQRKRRKRKFILMKINMALLKYILFLILIVSIDVVKDNQEAFFY